MEFVRIERLLGTQEAAGSTPAISSSVPHALGASALCMAAWVGSIPAWGCGGRTQMVRGQAVDLLLAGSTPVVHPKSFFDNLYRGVSQLADGQSPKLSISVQFRAPLPMFMRASSNW
jgi:hypothetical protein